MSIDSKVNAFLKSPEGKKKIAEAKAEALKSGKSFGQSGGTVFSKTSAKEAAEKMVEILMEKFASDGVNLRSIKREDIIIGEPQVQKNGDIFVDIQFKEDALFRPSLEPDRFEEGVPNIIVHLTHGWKAFGAVTGIWHGEETTSRMKFKGNPFMQQAVDDFNALKLGVAELSDKYKT